MDATATLGREESIDFARKYLEDLLSFFGLNIAVSATCTDDVIELSVPSTRLNGFLIGQRGETLRSLQYLLSMALKNKGAELTRINIDIADYKRNRADRLAEQARQWCREALESGQPMDLEPMNAADRRIVHRVVAEFEGLSSESQGEGKDRFVRLLPQAASEQSDT